MRNGLVSTSILALLLVLNLNPAVGSPSSSGYSKLISQAIAGELPIDVKDSLGRPVLITAITHGTVSDVEQLINKGYSPQSTHWGLKAITFTVSDACHANKLQALIDAGAKINTPNTVGYYPIHSAVQHSDLSCLETLIEHGADPEAQNKLGQTPYFHAVDFSNRKALERLWEAGADPSIKADNGLDVFHHAIIAEKTDLVRELLKRYHDANVSEDSDP